MPKYNEAKNTRQMFIDNFFNNAVLNGPTKTVGSDCSAAKKTCATFFTNTIQQEDQEGPHFYNLGSEQAKVCKRLNLKISKLKARAKCAQDALSIGKTRIDQVRNLNVTKYKSDVELQNCDLSEQQMRFERNESKNVDQLMMCKEVTRTTAFSEAEEQCEFVDKTLRLNTHYNADAVSSIDQNGASSKLPQELTNIEASSNVNKEAPAMYHNKLMDFIKQHQYTSPASAQKVKPNQKFTETPFDVTKQNCKPKNFHVFNENKVFDYHLNATYKVSRLIGKGSFAEVRLATRIADNKLVAIKSFSNSGQSGQQSSKVIQNEIRVLKSIDHPNIVKLLDIVVSKDFVHIVLDYCDGLNLYEYMYNRGGKRLSESLARRIFIQLLNAVDYLHRNNISHRDLKLDNIMIDRTGKVTIIDFGFAIQADCNTKINSFCGTPFYMAPEIYQMVSYNGPSVDMWALAVILFKLTVGEFPFKKTVKDQTPKTSIIEVNYIVPSDVSKGLIEIFEKVFVKDASSRVSMSQFLQLSWLYRGD